MWRGYGDNGIGGAVVFDGSKIEKSDNPLFLIVKLTSNPLVEVVIITGFVGLKLPKTRLEVPHCSGVVATKFPLVM